MFNVINLGAGVQSSTMALMAARGELSPMPEFAVFADTQAEPKAVYTWLDWLEKQLPFPVHQCTAGNLREFATKMKVTKDGRTYSTTAVPVFTLDINDGSAGKIMHRTCTRDFKIRPILKEIRKRCQVKRGEKDIVVTQWMGISLDEMLRAKPSREKWSEHRFPLIEKRMTRNHCLDWMERNGYPQPPRSACNFCPFHGRDEWNNLKTSDPAAFDDAVKFERELQEIKAASDTFKSKPFLHRSLIPLDQVDFRSDYDKGQLPLWQDECEGMCGV